jgi:hypothetical protein
VDFCLDALERALGWGRPEIFNSDQGSQFTSEKFTGVLAQRGVAISMNGRGLSVHALVPVPLVLHTIGGRMAAVRVRHPHSCAQINKTKALSTSRESFPGTTREQAVEALHGLDRDEKEVTPVPDHRKAL